MLSSNLFRLRIFIIISLVFHSGCILFEDLGEYWDKGFVDPELEDAWKRIDEKGGYISFISFTVSGDHYNASFINAISFDEMVEKQTIRLKSLKLGQHKFLMLDIEQYYKDIESSRREFAAKMIESGAVQDINELNDIVMQPEEKTNIKGAVALYSVDNGILKIYYPNEAILAKAIKEGEVKGSLQDEQKMIPATIAKLDEKAVKFLIRISNNPASWEHVEQFEQIDNLEEELAKAKKLFEEEQERVKKQFEEEMAALMRRCGTVVDSLGNPVGGASVILYGEKKAEEGQDFPLEVEVVSKTETDANGSFCVMEESIEEGAFVGQFILVESSDLALGCAHLYEIGESPNQAIVLSKTTTLAGKVVDEKGEPVSGAKVHAILIGREEVDEDLTYLISSTDYLTDTTDGYGKFFFNNIPSGVTAEFVVAAEGYVKTFTWDGSYLEKGKYEGGAADIEISVPKKASITGQVIEKGANKPVEGVEVFVVRKKKEAGVGWDYKQGTVVLKTREGDNQSVITKNDGTFSAESLMPGEYSVFLEPFNSHNRKWVSDRVCVSTGDVGKSEVTLYARRPGIVNIKVVDEANNSAIQGTNVTVNTMTALRESERKKDNVTRWDFSEVRIVPQGSSFEEGIVTTVYDNKSGENLIPIRTNENGIASFNLYPDTYKVTSVGRKEQVIVEDDLIIQVGEGETKDVEIQIRSVPSIDDTGVDVVVTDESGNGISGAQVYVAGNDLPALVTDEEGLVNMPIEYFAGPDSARKETYSKDENSKDNMSVVYSAGPAFVKKASPRWEDKGPRYLVAQDFEHNIGAIKEIRRKEQSIEIVLSDGFEISGRVVDNTGQPIPDADVLLSKIRERHDDSLLPVILYDSITNDDGFYSIKAIARGPHYILTTTADGYGGAKTELRTDPKFCADYIRRQRRRSRNDDRDRFPQKTFRIVEPNSPYTKLEDTILLEAGLAVSGSVVDFMGHPITDAVVYLEGKEQAEFEPVQTDENGRFRFETLCAGKVKLKIEPPEPNMYEFSSYYPTRAVVNAGNEDVRIIVRPTNYNFEESEPMLDNGGLVGILVVDAVSGEPVKEAFLNLKGENFANDAYLTANDEGIACLVLPPGKNFITSASKYEGYKETKRKIEIDVEKGQTYKILVKLTPKPRMSGIIVDEAGKPVGGAVLRIDPGDIDNFTFVTKADGKFNFTWDADSAFRESQNLERKIYLIINHERRNLASNIELNKENAENWKITLESAPTIAGVVTDPSGKPIPGINVKYEICKPVWSLYIRNEATKTNSRGEYQTRGMPPVPPGYKCKLDFYGKGYERKSIEFEPDELVPGEITMRDMILTVKKTTR